MKIGSNIAFIDCEMDGLDAEKNHLLEIAVVPTDPELVILDKQGFQAVIYYEPESVEAMKRMADPIVLEMHTKTGLWDRLSGPDALHLEEVDKRLLVYLARFGGPREMPVGGNSVRVDMNFIDKHLPRSSQYLDFHMRDVSTIAGLASDWYGLPWFQKFSDHTAMTDIRECIRELKHYRKRIFATVSETDTRRDIAVLLRRRAVMEAPNARAALEFMADVIEEDRELPAALLGELPQPSLAELIGDMPVSFDPDRGVDGTHSKCPTCGHRNHSGLICHNQESDNDCACKYGVTV